MQVLALELIVLVPLFERGVDAHRSAACYPQIETGKAEQDRGGAAVVERKEHRLGLLEHVAEEIGEGHFAGQDERHGAREQAEHQQRAQDKL